MASRSVPVEPVAADLALGGLGRRPPRGYWADAWDRFRHDALAMGGIVVLILLFTVAFSAPLISQYVTGYDYQRTSLTERYQTPSLKHLFGTDEFGRDYFTRIIFGGQVSLTLGLTVAAIQILIGVPLGLIAGYFGGVWDDVIVNFINFLDLLPTLIILIMLAAWIPVSVWSLALIIGLLGWTGVSRQVRGVVLSAKQRDYIDAARALGVGNGRIMFRHILPNVMSIVLVVAGFDVAGGVVAEAGLSYLGLGIRPPTPSWGNMLQNSLGYLTRAPHLIIFPGLFITLTTLSIFLAFQGLRDALDPRLRGIK